MIVLDLICLIIIAYAFFLNVYERKGCWYYWFAADTALGIKNWYIGETVQSIIFIMYAIGCIYGMYWWRNKRW